MFMVWVSSWNKCDAARHHKLNRAYGDANFSTSSHLSHRFSFMTRHQERQQTIVSTRNVPLRKRRWHTTRRFDGSHLPTPQAYRSFWKDRHWAIGSQAFKALMFILGVGNNNRRDRSRTAQSEQFMRRLRVPPQKDGPRKHRHNVSNQWQPSMPRSCDGTIVKTTMTCHLSNLLTDGPHVLRSIFTIARGSRPISPAERIGTLQSVVKRSKHQLGTTLQRTSSSTNKSENHRNIASTSCTNTRCH